VKRARFFCRPISKPVVKLTGTEAHHLAGVLRGRVGETVELFDGQGTLAEATITEITKGRVILEVKQLHVLPRRAVGRVIIASSLAKGERFAGLISRCTELGVERISPVRFERTIKQARGNDIAGRYEKLALAAAKQCERWFLPQIDPPRLLADALASLRKDYPQAEILVGSLSTKAGNILQSSNPDNDVVVFVGPEGGLTDGEQKLLLEYGAKETRLTDTILRIETAALAFAAILIAQRQDFKHRQPNPALE